MDGVEVRGCEGTGDVAAVGAKVEDVRNLALDVLQFNALAVGSDAIGRQAVPVTVRITAAPPRL